MSAQAHMIADLHLRHKKILQFEGHNRGDGLLETVEEHDWWIIESINATVGKRDSLYILGDIAFTKEGLEQLDKLVCRDIHFILGNHDTFPMSEYEKYGKVHTGLYKYKGVWLSHAPIHPSELRGRINIHGHIHSGHIKTWWGGKDKRYKCVSVEHCNGRPVPFNKIASQS